MTSVQDVATAIGQSANQPIGFEGIGEPGLCPSLVQAAFDRTLAITLPLLIEQRQFTTSLLNASKQPARCLPDGPWTSTGDRLRRFFLPRNLVIRSFI